MSSCSCPCVCYDDVWRDGGVTPRFYLDFRFRWVLVTFAIVLLAAKELGKDLVGRWMSARNGLDDLEKRNVPSPC